MPLKLSKRGATYYLRGTVAGNRIYESTGCSKRSEAEAYANRRETEIRQRHAFGEAETLKFAEAALTYMELGNEARFLAKILLYFGEDQRLIDIDNATLARAARDLYPNAAPATIRRQLITPVSAVYTLAAKEGKVPPRTFARPKGDQQRTRWLTPEEMERLLSAAAPHLAPILAFLVGTGARTSEALGLDTRNYYPNTGEAFLEETKNKHPRMLRAPERSRDMIEAWGRPEDGRLFRTPKGAPYKLTKNSGGNIGQGLAAARIAAKLSGDITAHTLRHTWATWYYSATHDFGGLLDLGGWRKSDMAMRYRKIAPADLPDRLAAHGWHFDRLGRDLTPLPETPLLRVVK